MEVLLKRLLGYGGTIATANAAVGESTLGLMPALALSGACTLFGVSIANVFIRHGDPRAELIFWVSLTCLVMPPVLRLVWPATGRIERIAILSWLGLAIYIVHLLESPIKFDGHDEYLHWATAIDIGERHHLFTINSLLPVSPQFPGLELLQSAFGQLSGLNMFESVQIIIAVLRVAGICALFFFYERVASSAWIASLACLIYMANSNFIGFLASFAYETIAIEFLIAGLFIAAIVSHHPSLPWWKVLGLTTPVAVALAISHHMTSWTGFVLFLFAALAAHFRQRERDFAWRLSAVAAVIFVSASIWGEFAKSDATNYIGGIVSGALSEFYALITGSRTGRVLFVADDGATTPVIFQVIALASVALTSLGLAIGFFRSLGLPMATGTAASAPVTAVFLGLRDNAFAIVLTLLTLGFPLSLALRLTGGGWELGNRMSAFVYLGVGLVVAVGIADFWYSNRASTIRLLIVSTALTTIILGGAITGNRRELLANPYAPAADGQSIEPMGISAARWTNTWLGEGWRFASDRVNRLLLATYGVQRVVTSEQDHEEPGLAMFNQLGDEEMNAIKVTRTDYLLVDLRLVRSRPKFDVYFSSAEDAALHQHAPLRDNLLKFDDMPKVGRPYDNGFEVIYDIRGLIKSAQ